MIIDLFVLPRPHSNFYLNATMPETEVTDDIRFI